MEATLRVFPTLLVALLLLPVATAAGSRVESTHPAAIEGAFGLEFPGGVVSLHAIETMRFELRGLTGSAIVYSWSAVAAGPVNTGTRPADGWRIPLENATIVGDLVSEQIELGVRMGQDGIVAVQGSGPSRPARPQWLESEWARSMWPVEVPVAPPSLDIRAPAGWGATGPHGTSVAPGWPEAPRLLVRGPGAFDLSGGNVTILHGNGSTEIVRLSPTTDASGGFATVERHSRLIFEGSIGEADVPLMDYWLVAGSSPVWHVEGSIDWPKASGQDDGVPFRDQPVHIEGDFTLRPDPSHNGALSSDLFGIEGEYTLAAAGIVLRSEPASPPPPVAAWTLASIAAGLLAWLASPHLAGRIVAPFYTRIAPADIATHPARSMICEHLGRSPGLHLRDLHRRVGGAWGTFSFHLGMLRQAGVIRFERTGRYVAVYLAHQQQAGPLPRTVTAQRVLEAIPRGGEALPVTLLRERVGLSRQLLDHHLTMLAEQGLVSIRDGRPRLVSRR